MEGESVDFVPLNRVRQIVAKGLEPTIKNYLSGVPLNIQAVVYDLGSRQLVDGGAIDAIRKQLVKVNDINSVLSCVSAKGVSFNEYIKGKAGSLGFGYEI